MARKPISEVVSKPPIKKPKVSAKGRRQKGSTFERECVAALVAIGIHAERVPLSGGAGGSFGSDIHAKINDQMMRIECKAKARAWSDLYKWLEGNHLVMIRRDRHEALVVMPMSAFIDMVGYW